MGSSPQNIRLAIWLFVAAGACTAETFTYLIEPCAGAVERESACHAGDVELSRWALAAWEQAAGNGVSFAPAPSGRARIRIFWASSRMHLYGEARPVMVKGKRGTEIYVNPDVAQLGSEIYAAAGADKLLREAIVYLTCLHESGHALGLSHTGKFEDIMYSFGYGGDIVKYFERYRRKLGTRKDIRLHSGMSAYDRERLSALFRKPQQPALR